MCYAILLALLTIFRGYFLGQNAASNLTVLKSVLKRGSQGWRTTPLGSQRENAQVCKVCKSYCDC
jgi:hypothetical protein